MVDRSGPYGEYGTFMIPSEMSYAESDDDTFIDACAAVASAPADDERTVMMTYPTTTTRLEPTDAQLRLEALSQAVRTRSESDTDEVVVVRAKAYYEFLCGDVALDEDSTKA